MRKAKKKGAKCNSLCVKCTKDCKQASYVKVVECLKYTPRIRAVV